MAFPIFGNKKTVLHIVMALLLSLLIHVLIIWMVGGRTSNDADKNKAPKASPLEVAIVKRPIAVKSEASIEKQKIISNDAVSQKPVAALSLPQIPKAAVTKSEKPSAPPMTVPLNFDPVFYTWREVDVPASPQRNDKDNYPAELKNAETRERLFIELWIDETGKVDEVKINHASLSDDLKKIIISYYKKIRFTPAMKDGKFKRFRTPMVLELGDPSLPPGEKDESVVKKDNNSVE